MNTSSQITSLKELEAFFSATKKVFSEKETDENWSNKDSAIKNLRSVINNDDYMNKWKSSILKFLHDSVNNYMQSVHSLRSSIVIEMLSLVQDIGKAAGVGLDLFTIEIIMLNLLKVSSNTKKMISSKVKETANSFVSCVSFSVRVFLMICKAINEKNMQIRDFAASLVKTMLTTNGPKESARLNIDKQEMHQQIDHFFKKGLSDASPLVRDICRQTYTVYCTYWPIQGAKLLKTLDANLQRQLKTANKDSKSARRFAPYSLENRSKSMTSLPSKSSEAAAFSSSSARKQETLKRLSSDLSAKSAEQQSSQSSDKSRLSKISNSSAPSANTTHDISKAKTATNAPIKRAQSDLYHGVSISTASILTMLKSRDPSKQCKATRVLFERLQSTTYDPSVLSSLPVNVPARNDVDSVLKNMLWLPWHAFDNKKKRLYRALMGWESLAGVFVHYLMLHEFIFHLIIGHQVSKSKSISQKILSMCKLCGEGLARMKLFLKYNHSDLPNELLKLMDIVNDMREKHSLQQLEVTTHSNKQGQQEFSSSDLDHLQLGLLEWMYELVSGIDEEDQNMVLDGSRWLAVPVSNNCTYIEDWFEDKSHLRSYIDFTMNAIVTSPDAGKGTDDPKHDLLFSMVHHLKITDEELFAEAMKSLSRDNLFILEDFMGLEPTTTSTVNPDTAITSAPVVNTNSSNSPSPTLNSPALNSPTLNSPALNSPTPDSPTSIPSNTNSPTIDTTANAPTISSQVFTEDDSFMSEIDEEIDNNNGANEANDKAYNEAKDESNTELLYEEEYSIQHNTLSALSPTITSFSNSQPNEDILENQTTSQQSLPVRDNIASVPELAEDKKQHYTGKESVKRSLTYMQREDTEYEPIIEPQSPMSPLTIHRLLPLTRPEVDQLMKERGERASKKLTAKINEMNAAKMSIIMFIDKLKLDPSHISKYTFDHVQKSVTSDATYTEGMNEQIFRDLLQQLVKYIRHQPRFKYRTEAINTMKAILGQHADLIKQINERESDASDRSFVRSLYIFFIECMEKNDFFFIHRAQQATDLLLASFSPKCGFNMLMSMLDRQFQFNEPTSLNALFTQVSEVIPNFKAAEITSFLNHGLKERLVKGFGHENIHVQLGAHYASASIYKILGAAFIPRYLNEVDELQLNWFLKDINFPTPKQYIEMHCKGFK
ncbi:MAG: clasp N terminal-domain-containing protein [Benjaminiella poitrasii]|nr:MAG: clasp N terminal-domain-containing protein [Benjaminiella poitrasii]